MYKPVAVGWTTTTLPVVHLVLMLLLLLGDAVAAAVTKQPAIVEALASASTTAKTLENSTSFTSVTAFPLLPPPSTSSFVSKDADVDSSGGGGNGSSDQNMVNKAAAAGAADDSGTVSYRLPDALVPEHYDVSIDTHLGDDADDGDYDVFDDANVAFRFSGHVEIRVHCSRDTDRIVLHSRNLSIDAVHVTSSSIASDHVDSSPPASQQQQQQLRYETDAQREFLVITVTETLRRGQAYTIRVAFRAAALLQDTGVGYYRTGYRDEASNRTSWLSVTQFETIHARRAFPCFDEPALKATFSVTLGHRRGWQTLSNMPLRAQTACPYRNDWLYDHFETTIRLPTYLIAFCVHTFPSRQLLVTNLTKPIQLRAFAQPAYLEHVDFALKTAARSLAILEAHLDLALPVTKIDLFAVPAFPFAGMENWGLITFAEEAMLYAPGQSTSAQRHHIAIVVAHELAHQWFGNMVTLCWWSEMWLNEAFASYFEEIAVQQLAIPTANWANAHLLENYPSILSSKAEVIEALVNEQSWRTGSETEAGESAWVVYSRGAALLRMTQRLLGEKAFRRSVRKYLKMNALQNVQSADWWSLVAAEVAAGNETVAQTFVEAMHSWTYTAGFPLITVQRDYEHGLMNVSQRRFQLPGENGRNGTALPAESSCWYIPLGYTTHKSSASGDGASHFAMNFGAHWLHCPIGITVIPLPESVSSTQYVLFNANLSGIYRVDYDMHNWKLLLAQLAGPHFRRIGTRNRAQLLDDLFTYAWWSTGEPGDGGLLLVRQLRRWLRQEDGLWVWKVAIKHFEWMAKGLKKSAEVKRRAFSQYVRDTITPVYVKIRPKNDDADNEPVNVPQRLDRSELQAVILRAACTFGAGDCDHLAQRFFAKWFNQSDPDANNPIPVNLRAAIYCHAMRTTDGDQPNILQFMLERINRAASSHERARIIDAFFCTLTEYRVEDDVEEDANNTHDTHDDDDDYYDEDDDDDDAERRDANEVQIELTDRHLSSMLPHRHAIDIGVGTKSLPPHNRNEMVHLEATIKRLNAVANSANSDRLRQLYRNLLMRNRIKFWHLKYDD